MIAKWSETLALSNTRLFGLTQPCLTIFSGTRDTARWCPECIVLRTMANNLRQCARIGTRISQHLWRSYSACAIGSVVFAEKPKLASASRCKEVRSKATGRSGCLASLPRSTCRCSSGTRPPSPSAFWLPNRSARASCSSLFLNFGSNRSLHTLAGYRKKFRDNAPVIARDKIADLELALVNDGRASAFGPGRRRRRCRSAEPNMLFLVVMARVPLMPMSQSLSLRERAASARPRIFTFVWGQMGKRVPNRLQSH